MSKNVKLLLKALAVVLVTFALGYVMGRLLGKGTKGVDLPALLKKVDNEAAGILLGAAHLLLTIVSLICASGQFYCLNKAAAKWDGEDEDFIDDIEERLNAPMKLVSNSQVFNIVIFLCSAYFFISSKAWYTLIPTAVFLVGAVWQMMLTEKLVTLEKKLNPEKKGSAFDPKFRKKWIESCDEAQKQIIWRAGFEGFQKGSTACVVVMMLAGIFQLVFRTGILPVICLGAVWLIMNNAYMKAAENLERRKQ
jgi:hypothetical protein